MPFSHSGQISTILQAVERLQPRSVLDVGVGMGQYGFLLRNNLEHLNLFQIDGQQGRLRDRREWRVQIDGIEGFAGYITPVHDWAYNKVSIGNALDLLPRVASGAYELVMAIDILEHFDHAEGERFVKECQRIASRKVLISTPKDFIAQTVEANPLEDHRSVWTRQELATLGLVQVLEDATSWVVMNQA